VPPDRVSVSEIGDAENISKSYVSWILRLALLAPDIVEAILAGSADQSLMLERLERPLPASWEEQRRALKAEDGDDRSLSCPSTRSQVAPMAPLRRRRLLRQPSRRPGPLSDRAHDGAHGAWRR
jgi:hypothetical protein